MGNGRRPQLEAVCLQFRRALLNRTSRWFVESLVSGIDLK